MDKNKTVKSLLDEEQQMSLIQFYYSLLQNDEDIKILDINESPNRIFNLKDFDIVTEGNPNEWFLDSV